MIRARRAGPALGADHHGPARYSAAANSGQSRVGRGRGLRGAPPTRRGEREEVRAFLALLVKGKTQIRLQSRGSVPWLEAGVIRKGTGLFGGAAPGHALNRLDTELQTLL